MVSVEFDLSQRLLLVVYVSFAVVLFSDKLIFTWR